MIYLSTIFWYCMDVEICHDAVFKGNIEGDGLQFLNPTSARKYQTDYMVSVVVSGIFKNV